MDLFTSIITIFAVLTSVIVFYSKWKHSYWRRKGVSQLEPQFFFGDVKGMIKGDSSIADSFLSIYKRFKAKGVQYGGIYTSYRKDFIPIDPKMIKNVMQKDFDYFTAHFPGVGSGILFKSLFHLQGEAWRNTRKGLTPTFTSGKMKMMYETLLEKTTGLESLIKEYSESGKPVNVKDALGRFTSDVIGSCGFGINCNAMKDPNSEFVKHGRLILDPPAKKAGLFQQLLTVLGVRRMRKNIKPAEEFFKDIVKESIEYRERNNIFMKDFLHLMIQLKNRGVVSDDDHIFQKDENMFKAASKHFYNLDDITAQCLLFFIAGYETSATTMSFALLELSQHPEMQQKIREESNRIIEKYNGKLTYDAMMELTYTEQVVEETLRKYPPLSIIPRMCTKNYIIPGTDIIIEKGTLVHIPAWGLHLDPEYFPNPEQFDPERFSAENKKKIQDFTYIPFGEGPRMCLGLRFGMMQTKVGLVSLLRNYNFTLNNKTTLPIKTERDTLITTVSGGVWVDATKAN